MATSSTGGCTISTSTFSSNLGICARHTSIRFNGNNQRKNLYCTHCTIKRHYTSECRTNKCEGKEKAKQINVVTEIASMARENTNEDIPQYGNCVMCYNIGQAFMYCAECGEDSGAIYIPIRNSDYSSTEDEYSSNDAIIPEINLNGNPDNITAKTEIDSDAEADFCSIADLDQPFFSNDYYNEYIAQSEDILASISITELFAKVYEHDNMENLQRSEEDYVYARVSEMELFNYTNIPQILKNIGNITFNTRLYNEHYLQLIKPIQRPRPIIWEYTEYERNLIVRWGVHIIQQFLSDNFSIPDGSEDILASIPITELFAKVYEHDKMENLQRSQEDYVSARVSEMELFNYNNIPQILKNIGNITFYTRLYDEHYLELIKPIQRPRPIIWEYTEYERNLMVRWGVHIIQQFVSDNFSSPDEYCFMMSEFNKWNINNTNKKYNITNNKWLNQPTNNLGKGTHIWIADSGASCHFTNDDTGMYNCQQIHERICVGDGREVLATKQGSILVEVHQRNGTKTLTSIKYCKYVPELQTNLFSITRAISTGWKLGNTGVHITLEKDDIKIVFDRVDRTSYGFVITAIMVPVTVHHKNNLKL
jgi:hypothetical protein